MFSFAKTLVQRSVVLMLVMVLLAPGTTYAARPVSIKTPTNNEIVSGVYMITGNGGGAATQVSIDGGAWVATSGGKNWSYSWDTTAYTNGAHTVYARYADGTSMTSVNVTVDNGSTNLRQPVVGEVVINEFVAANGTIQTSEWVEL